MAQEVTNFARFYALFNKLPFNGDREEFKKSIVLQYTWNRTDSLREMTRLEYKTCCEGLEKLAGVDERRQKMQEELKYWRSVCLRLMQKWESTLRTGRVSMTSAGIPGLRERRSVKSLRTNWNNWL